MAERLSADTVCSKDCSSGLADSVVASGRLGVELAFLLLETRADDRTPPVEVLLADADADDVMDDDDDDDDKKTLGGIKIGAVITLVILPTLLLQPK